MRCTHPASQAFRFRLKEGGGTMHRCLITLDRGHKGVYSSYTQPEGIKFPKILLLGDFQ
jgi:hypothetical protein